MSSSASWELKIDKGVFLSLSKFPRIYGEKIIRTIESLPLDPYAGDIRKIKGEEHVWRRRVGAHRFFYELNPTKRVIHVFRVERRTSSTY
ncbi:MAG: hypothetical protein G01um101472_398 [Parcubacteria group bacterium Gr01-1014_72]|nr:MAG: hypothetical protein G01um101472_398 [Parcubacteria group bacterium Gr01-1014_72]